MSDRKIEEISLEQKIVNFFVDNPYPTDDKVHAFSAELGMNEEMLEKKIYELVSTILCGGKSREKENIDKVFDEEQLKTGLDIEYEHVDKNSPFADILSLKIAKDHLSEFRNYYIPGLVEMERKLEEFKNEYKVEGKNMIKKESRTAVKVTFSNGNVINTEINGNLEDAKKYYLGNEFNIGRGEHDKMAKAVKVEPIEEQVGGPEIQPSMNDVYHGENKEDELSIIKNLRGKYSFVGPIKNDQKELMQDFDEYDDALQMAKKYGITLFGESKLVKENFDKELIMTKCKEVKDNIKTALKEDRIEDLKYWLNYESYLLGIVDRLQTVESDKLAMKNDKNATIQDVVSGIQNEVSGIEDKAVKDAAEFVKNNTMKMESKLVKEMRNLRKEILDVLSKKNGLGMMDIKKELIPIDFDEKSYVKAINDLIDDDLIVIVPNNGKASSIWLLNESKKQIKEQFYKNEIVLNETGQKCKVLEFSENFEDVERYDSDFTGEYYWKKYGIDSSYYYVAVQNIIDGDTYVYRTRKGSSIVGESKQYKKEEDYGFDEAIILTYKDFRKKYNSDKAIELTAKEVDISEYEVREILDWNKINESKNNRIEKVMLEKGNAADYKNRIKDEREKIQAIKEKIQAKKEEMSRATNPDTKKKAQEIIKNYEDDIAAHENRIKGYEDATKAVSKYDKVESRFIKLESRINIKNFKPGDKFYDVNGEEAEVERVYGKYMDVLYYGNIYRIYPEDHDLDFDNMGMDRLQNESRFIKLN